MEEFGRAPLSISDFFSCKAGIENLIFFATIRSSVIDPCRKLVDTEVK